jgi:murein L,D-transpeptidase YcbB/YkuD
MSNLTPQQEKFQFEYPKLLGMTFQDALKWLYSEGWYFQTEPEAWKSNSALFQDITTNGMFGSYMKYLHPKEVNYLVFKSVHMKTPVLMRHGAPNFESNAWPNDVIKDLLGIGRYDAINKRKI